MAGPAPRCGPRHDWSRRCRAADVIASSSVVLSHHTPIGWNPKPPLNVAAACSFSECAVTKRGVDVQHHRLAEIGAGDLRRRQRWAADSTRGGRPWARAFSTRSTRPGWPHPSSATPSAASDRAEQAALVPQRVDVGDRLTTGGQHGRDVHPHLAAIMDRGEPPPRQRRRQASR